MLLVLLLVGELKVYGFIFMNHSNMFIVLQLLSSN